MKRRYMLTRSILLLSVSAVGGLTYLILTDDRHYYKIIRAEVDAPGTVLQLKAGSRDDITDSLRNYWYLDLFEKE